MIICHVKNQKYCSLEHNILIYNEITKCNKSVFEIKFWNNFGRKFWDWGLRIIIGER